VDGRTDDVIDLCFLDVSGLAFVAELISALEVIAAAAYHFEVFVRRCVIDAIVFWVVFDPVFGTRMSEGLRQAGLLIRIEDRVVASEAEFGIDMVSNCKSLRTSKAGIKPSAI